MTGGCVCGPRITWKEKFAQTMKRRIFVLPNNSNSRADARKLQGGLFLCTYRFGSAFSDKARSISVPLRRVNTLAKVNCLAPVSGGPVFCLPKIAKQFHNVTLRFYRPAQVQVPNVPNRRPHDSGGHPNPSVRHDAVCRPGYSCQLRTSQLHSHYLRIVCGA